jgi:hypothetical protein
MPVASMRQKKCNSLSFIGNACVKFVKPKKAKIIMTSEVNSTNHWMYDMSCFTLFIDISVSAYWAKTQRHVIDRYLEVM